MNKATITVPGCAPQLPAHERAQSAAINPANSFTEHFKAKPETRIPESHVAGLPAFRCVQADAPRGKWTFRCTCGRWHVHGAGEGPRASECDAHRPHGYYLLPPHDFIPANRPANTSPIL